MRHACWVVSAAGGWGYSVSYLGRVFLNKHPEVHYQHFSELDLFGTPSLPKEMPVLM